LRLLLLFFFFTPPSPTFSYTLSLHDALPICFSFTNVRIQLQSSWVTPACIIVWRKTSVIVPGSVPVKASGVTPTNPERSPTSSSDRKSTRLNSSHVEISYAVFCLKKKKKNKK